MVLVRIGAEGQGRGWAVSLFLVCHHIELISGEFLFLESFMKEGTPVRFPTWSRIVALFPIPIAL